MARSRSIPGDVRQWEAPDWGPLLAVASEVVDQFMWMHEVQLGDGSRVHAYKHCLTRRYLHLGTDGSAYAFTRSGRYRRVELADLLDAAFLPLREDRLATPAEIAAAAAVTDRARGIS